MKKTITILLLALSLFCLPVVAQTLSSETTVFQIPVNPKTGEKFTFRELHEATGDLEVLVSFHRARFKSLTEVIRPIIKNQQAQANSSPCESAADAYYDGCMIASQDEWYCFVVTELYLRYCLGLQ